jgi:hypothetical protein
MNRLVEFRVDSYTMRFLKLALMREQELTFINELIQTFL